MLNFREYFERREMDTMAGNDEIATLSFDSGEDDVFFATFSGFFDNPRNWVQIPEDYQQSCVFDIGLILEGSGVCLVLFGFTKRNKDMRRFGKLLHPKTWDEKRHKTGALCSIAIGAFSDDYASYLVLCERFVNGGELPLDTTLAEFFEVSAAELVAGRYLPSFYTDDKRKARATLANEKTVPLGEIADVLNPRKMQAAAKDVLVIQPKNMRFPMRLDDLKRGGTTNVPLPEGDILINAISQDFRAILFE